MKELIQHLVNEHLPEIAAKSFLDCHVRGIHSIMLLDAPEHRVRLFVATEQHELYKNSSKSLGSLAAHSHHCNLTLHCVRGMFTQIEYRDDPQGPFKAYRYQSALLSGTRGFKREEAGGAVALDKFYWVREGQSIHLPAHLVHSVYVPADAGAAWLVYEGKEDAAYTSLSYSDQDLEQAQFQGLYGKMSEAQVVELLQYAGLLAIPTKPTIPPISLEGERWLPAPGFEGRYLVSDKGRVWSEFRQRLRKPLLTSKGYWQISLRDSAIEVRTVLIHRLVALAFLPNPDSLATVNHIDLNSQNNNLENLEWSSQADNNAHARKMKFNGVRATPIPASSSRIAVLEIAPSGEVIRRHASIKDAAKALGILESNFRYFQNRGEVINGNRFVRESANPPPIEKEAGQPDE